jgi:hypothetical protein
MTSLKTLKTSIYESEMMTFKRTIYKLD